MTRTAQTRERPGDQFRLSEEYEKTGLGVLGPTHYVPSAQALEIAAVEFAKHGIAIERVMTDNGWAHTHGPRYAGGRRYSVLL